MKPREFEELAFEYWGEIPDDYKRGIDGLRVLRRSKPHDELPDIYTLGECVTEAYPSDYGSSDTTRSVVVLYHGSFEQLSRLDPKFDWEEELWETLTHELRHHLESLADEDALGAVDYAADENFKRYEGEPFDPFFYRSGEPVTAEDLAELRLDAGATLPLSGWRVESDWFFQATYAPADPPRGRATLEWNGARHAFDLPALDADVVFGILGDGYQPNEPRAGRVDETALVLVRRTSTWRDALDALRGRSPSVAEYEIDVTTTDAPP